MNRVKHLKRIAVLLVLVSLMAATQVLAQIRFEIPLRVTDGVVAETLYFGILQGGHYCIDPRDSINVHREFSLPIGPEPYVFDARFVWPRSGSGGDCYDQGGVYDYRPLTSIGQKDTFRVKGQLGKGTNLIMSWPVNLASRFDQLRLRYFDQIIGLNVNIDMLTNTSANVTTAGDPATVNIYSTGLVVTSLQHVPPDVPREFVLEQNYPNPFNPSTRIGFSVSGSGYVSLKVFDVLGREVATLLEGNQEPGSHSVEWNAEGFSSGVYICRVQTLESIITKRMLLIR